MTSFEVLEAIRRWAALYGEPPTTADWDPYRARQIDQSWRIGRYDAGRWPSAKTVRNHFGRFSEAIAAAGLVPRRQGQSRPQPRLALDGDTNLHLAYMRCVREGPVTPRVLAEAVREVSRAALSEHRDDLRAALIDLAATALSWAAIAEHDSAPDPSAA